MAAANDSEKLLFDAIRNDDIEGGKSLISANPELLDLAVQTSSGNFLILACQLRRFGFISMIGRFKPELACERVQGGYTVLHLACINGDEEMVRALVDFRCPDSIEVLTPLKQTVFHLAAENYKVDAFAVLLNYAKELNKEYLLYKEDHQGNTVLHIAVREKQLRIVKMCRDLSSTAGHGFAIWDNAKNIDGHTALDLYGRISPDDDSETLEIKEIGRILHEPSGRDVSSSNQSICYPKTSTIHPSKTLETTNVQLVVLALFIGLAFSVTCALPSFFPQEYLVAIAVVFELKDIVYGKLPHIFYIMSFITVLLSTSSYILSVLLYSLPCGTLMLLGGVAIFILYFLLANYVMPKFSVRVGSHHVPSNCLMFISALGFIGFGALIIHLGNFLMRLSYNHAKRVMKKVVSKFRPPSNDMMPLRNPSFGVQMVGTANRATTSTSNK